MPESQVLLCGLGARAYGTLAFNLHLSAEGHQDTMLGKWFPTRTAGVIPGLNLAKKPIACSKVIHEIPASDLGT